MIGRLLSGIFAGRAKPAAGVGAPFAQDMVPKSDHRFAHFMVHGHVDAQLTTYEVGCTREDEQIARRLLEAYRLAASDEARVTGRPAGDLWQHLRNGVHKEFIRLLDENDAPALAHHLCEMSKFDTTFGISQGATAYAQLSRDAGLRQLTASFFMDKLVTLAEAIGCLPRENPEAGRWGENLYTDIDELVAKIEAGLGIDITPPKISGGLYGVTSKKGGYHFRDINGIYAAWRVASLLKGVREPAICEIGAGTGRTAYYCRRMGIDDITIIDLPYVGVISAWYLIKAFPDARVVLHGEDANEGRGAQIRVLPYWSHAAIAQDRFDLTLNQDSFPEIGPEAVVEYLSHARRNTTRYFLSINQEGRAPQPRPPEVQLVVSQIIRQHCAAEYEPVYRFPCWVREGYVEELFRIVKPAPPA